MSGLKPGTMVMGHGCIETTFRNGQFGIVVVDKGIVPTAFTKRGRMARDVHIITVEWSDQSVSNIARQRLIVIEPPTDVLTLIKEKELCSPK